MQKSKKLYALHGFLGKPTDWNFIQNATPLNVLDYANFSFWEVAQKINAQLNQNADNVIVGYSLGARLAMHAVIDAPHLWKGAIFISGHPGLTNPEDKSKRLLNDQDWAERFKKDPWDSLMKRWNDQPVFANLPSPFKRNEEDFSRSQLAHILVNWSLAVQEDLKDRLSDLSLPILWMAGKKDQKYAQLVQPFPRRYIAPHSAHRVPWDEPEAFLSELNKFLGDL